MNTTVMKNLGIFLMIIGTIIFIFSVASNSAKGDTLVCERYYLGISKSVILVFSEISSDEITSEDESDFDIVYVQRAFNGYSYVKYRNGEYIFLHSEITPCHMIKGDNDKIEQQIVKDFINKLTSNNLN